MAVIGAGASEDRSIAALNIALAAARDGASVLMIDADHTQPRHLEQGEPPRQERTQPSRLAQHRQPRLPARSRPRTEFRSCPPSRAPTRKAGDAIRKAIAQARSAGGYDLVILDGPAMPWSAADRKLLDSPMASSPSCRHLDINDAMEDIITALGGTERKLIGVVLNELNPRPSTVSETNNMLERRANPVGEPLLPACPGSRWAGCGSPCSTSSRPRTS